MKYEPVIILSLSSLNGHFSNKRHLISFILVGRIYPYEKKMEDKFLYSLKILFLIPVLMFAWREQESVFALQGKHFYFNFLKVPMK